MTIVYTFIVGDLFHVNHVRFLHLAKEFGNWLIVGVLSDDVVESYKRRPFFPLAERLEIVRNIRSVDEVIIQKSRSPLKNIKKIHPNIVVHADDWKNDFPDKREIEKLNVKIMFTPYLSGTNTTKIIEKIKNVRA